MKNIAQSSTSSCKTYRINLGPDEIGNIDEDCAIIFENFSLLSWLSLQYKPLILYLRPSPEGIPYYHAKALKNRFQIQMRVEIFLFIFKKIPQSLTYMYFIQKEPPPMRKENQIVVQFQKGPSSINIEINDYSGFFQCVFDQSQRQSFIKKRGPKMPNTLQYRYQEPDNQRNRYERQRDHFHLAFKGGGAKGVGYVGAYKAIKDLYPDAYIRSIVGSSAGGMIALAISAGASIEQLSEICRRMNDIPKQRVVNSQSEVTIPIQQNYEELIAKWRQILHDYGILPTSMFDILAEDVFDDQVINKIMDILTGNHDALKTMFSIEKQQVVYEKKSCFSRLQPIGITKRDLLVNFYGFLNGHLLRGDGVILICKKVLSKMLRIKFQTDRQGFFRALNMRSNYVFDFEGNVQSIAGRLTMLEYYKMNSVEFTCTATDLEDTILRFLNHKTSPHVPVCKAVQMTSSYPVAFEAIRWKKQWGKYYIHYKAFRKEIDLTGHQFTDGGLLCNFPIKFLDNQKIRPYYFSHAPSHKTHIFGFGLSQMPPEEASKEQARLQQLNKQELSEMIKKRLPKFKLFWAQLFQRPSSGFIAVESLTSALQLPIIKFAKTLIDTYIESNQNFAKECFAGRIYLFNETIPMGKYLLNKITPNQAILKMADLRKTLVMLYQQMQVVQYSYQNLYKYIKACLTKSDGSRFENLSQAKVALVKNIKDYALYHLFLKRATSQSTNSFTQNQTPVGLEIDKMESIFNDILIKVGKIFHLKVFPRSDSYHEDLTLFVKLLDRWYHTFQTAGNKNPQLRHIMVQHINHFFVFTKKQDNSQMENLLHIVDERVRQVENQIICLPINTINNRNNQLIESLSRFSKNFTYKNTNSYPFIVEALDKVDHFSVQQERQFQANRQDLYEYIEIMITNQINPNIHLVWQSQGVLSKYYLDTYRLINQYIFTNETRKTAYLATKITSMIIKANQREDPNYKFRYQDLFVFIVVKSDLHKFIIKNLVNLPRVIDLGYIKFQINEDLYEIIQTKIKQRKSNICRITNITCSALHSFTAFMITAGFDSNRIMAEVSNIQNLLKIDPIQIQKDFYKMDWNIPFKCKIRQFQDVLWRNRFDLFKSMETSAYYNNLSPNMKLIKQQFQRSRDIIQDGFYTILDYVIATQIQSDQRPKQTSFEQFMAKKLSFTYGDKDYKQINSKIGKQTRNVLRIFYKQYYGLIRHMVFRYSTQTDIEFIAHNKNPIVREAIWKGLIMTNFINSEKLKLRVQQLLIELNLPKDIKIKQFYDVCPVKIELTFTAVDITAECIQFLNRHTYPEMPIWAAIAISSTFSSLFSPVKAKPEWTQTIDTNYEQRYLNAFFSQEQTKQPVFISGNLLSTIPLEYVTNRKIQELCFNKKQFTFLTFGLVHVPADYILDRLFYRSFINTSNIIKLFLTNFKYINLAPIGQLYMLSSYANGEDNLTMQIYDKQLLSLPIRLSTLDFHKFQKPDVLPNIIEETYYYTIEKFCRQNLTFIKVILRQGVLSFKFISKEYKTTDLENKYNVEFRTQKTPFYQKVHHNIINLTHRRKLLFLRFTYVDYRFTTRFHKKLQIFQSQYRLDISGLQIYEYFEAIYGFAYGTAINGALQPQKVPFVVFLPGIQNSLKKMPVTIYGKSIIDIETSGLYCQLCCSPLKSKSKKEMAIANLLEDKCSKCQRKRSVKYVCQNKYGQCFGRYCMKCCKKQVLFKTNQMFYCNLGHQYKFLNKTDYVLRSEQVPHSRCDICMEYTDSYYHDEVCDNTICQPCSSEYIFKAL